jgi:ubiquinone/menaquinone biosynthesis C-methylase UbiE
MTPTTHDEEILDQFTKQAEPFLRRHEHSNLELLERMAECAQAQPGDRVLDIACGPGIVSTFFAKRVTHVTGLDIVPEMLKQARGYAAEQKLDNAEFVPGSCTALPFPDDSFDVVVTRFSFHHFLDPAAALMEMRRVAKPGGTIVVADVAPRPEVRDTFNRWEKLRDPSHTSAKTEAELEAMGPAAGLALQRKDTCTLEMELDNLLASSFPPLGNAEKIRALFAEEVRNGTDRLGVAAASDGGRVRTFYPVAMFAWKKPD